MLYPGNLGKKGIVAFSSVAWTPRPCFFFEATGEASVPPFSPFPFPERQSNSAATGPGVAVSNRTASASFFSLVPQHALHGISDIYPCSRVFTNSLSVFSNRRSRFGITPSHHVPVPRSPFLSVPYI